jgi:hypothetical protein
MEKDSQVRSELSSSAHIKSTNASNRADQNVNDEHAERRKKNVKNYAKYGKCFAAPRLKQRDDSQYQPDQMRQRRAKDKGVKSKHAEAFAKALTFDVGNHHSGNQQEYYNNESPQAY